MPNPIAAITQNRSPAQRRLGAWPCAAIFLLWMGAPLHAQQRADGVVVTLEEALARAAVHNPDYRQAQNNLRISSLNVRQGWLDLLPQLNVNLLSTNSTWNRTTVAEDFFGNPLENPTTRSVQTTNSNQGVVLQGSVDVGQILRLRRNYAQQNMDESTSRLRVDAVRADVMSAYLTAWERQTALELEREILERTRITLEATEELFRIAARNRVDLLAAELDVAEQEASVEQREADLRIALLALRNVIGDPDLVDFSIHPVQMELFDPADLDEAALVNHALTATPRVRQQLAAIDMERRNASVLRAAWLPTVRFGMGTTRRRFVEGGGAFLDPLPGDTWDRNVVVNLALPDLGQIFARRISASRSDYALRNQQDALRQTRGSAEYEIRSALEALRAAYRYVGLQERRVSIADERVALLNETSSSTFFENQNAAQAAAQARRQLLQARLSFERAKLSLERGVAAPVSGFMRAREN